MKPVALFLLLCAPALADLASCQKSADRKDWDTAFKECSPLAKLGDAVPRGYIAFMYEYGQGVPQDDKEAVRWFRPLAEEGNPLAQLALQHYNLGKGVPQDYAEAVRWFRSSADQGFAYAQANLGIMYAFGKGVPQDDREAVRWLRLASDQGLADAQFSLAATYNDGHGVPQDYKEAARLLALSADQGNSRAQNNLGVMFANGHGVPQDYVQAHMWWNLAGASGDAEVSASAIEARDKIAAKMTAAQTAEAQGLAREWKPKK